MNNWVDESYKKYKEALFLDQLEGNDNQGNKQKTLGDQSKSSNKKMFGIQEETI